MREPLRALMVEDSDQDALLVTLELSRAGYDAAIERVESLEALRAALSGGVWDVVLSDFQLVGFNAMDALAVAREVGVDVPFIIVSGSVGEDVAVEAMRAGARDYFRKEHLERLGPAIDREVREARSRKRLREAEIMARTSLENAREAAENANRTKDEFLATVSHELRTPLNAMLGWVVLLRQGALEPSMHERALATIERNAREQARLIEDLLDVSSIATGKLSLRSAPTELRPVVEAAIESVKLAAEAKRIAMVEKLEPGNLVVDGDADRLRQVVWNLLSNAIKFTPDGGHVVIELSRKGTNAEVAVEDDGIGLDPSFAPHIFERFRQADASVSRQYGGLGVGLTIVKQLVELHGGEIVAHSPGLGLGTRLTVSLPASHDRPSKPSDAPRPLPPLGALKLLVVEDDDDARVLAQAVLERAGAHVTTASSAAEALTALEQERFDVLVSDIGMPVEDGYALVRKIRARTPEQGGLMPAIALTAFASKEDAERAIGAGFQRHLPKPLDPKRLVTAVSELLSPEGGDPKAG